MSDDDGGDDGDEDDDDHDGDDGYDGDDDADDDDDGGGGGGGGAAAAEAVDDCYRVHIRVSLKDVASSSTQFCVARSPSLMASCMQQHRRLYRLRPLQSSGASVSLRPLLRRQIGF